MSFRKVRAKRTEKKPASSGLFGKIKSGVSRMSGAASSSAKGGRKKGHKHNSPEYWAKKVIVAKLKKKYFRTKYGSV